ncbi:MAG: nitroreductase family protein [Bacteroidales bacterium]|nr:nitroreductase family protein [Bacteroidales bacterium]
MELKDAIFGRRTVRSFKPEAILDEVLNEILEAGTWAPSHGNNQPWEFLLAGPQTRERLLEAYRKAMEAGPLANPELPEERKQNLRKFCVNFGNAPIVLAVSYPPATTELDKYDFPLSAAAAIQNILLMAWEKNVAGLWLSFGANPAAKSIFNLPENSQIAGILVMGYPEIVPTAQTRSRVEAKLHRLP